MKKAIECETTENKILHQSENDSSFSAKIYKDLVTQGYSGDELISRFNKQQKNIERAINDISAKADDIACGRKKGAGISDVFGEK